MIGGQELHGLAFVGLGEQGDAAIGREAIDAAILIGGKDELLFESEEVVRVFVLGCPKGSSTVLSGLMRKIDDLSTLVVSGVEENVEVDCVAGVTESGCAGLASCGLISETLPLSAATVTV